MQFIFEILADVDPVKDIRDIHLELVSVGPGRHMHGMLFWGFVERGKSITREELDQAQAYLASERGWTQMPKESELIPEVQA